MGDPMRAVILVAGGISDDQMRAAVGIIMRNVNAGPHDGKPAACDAWRGGAGGGTRRPFNRGRQEPAAADSFSSRRPQEGVAWYAARTAACRKGAERPLPILREGGRPRRRGIRLRRLRRRHGNTFG